MKRLNENPDGIECSFVLDFTFTLLEADSILAASTGIEAKIRLGEILKTKTPTNPVIGEFQFGEFKTAVGIALVARREAELKMLAAPVSDVEVGQ